MKKALKILEGEGTEYYYPLKTHLYFRGDIASEFFIIEKGQVELSIINYEGEKIIIEELGPGEYFGQIELFSNLPRCVNAFVEARTKLISIKTNRLREIILKNNDLAFTIIEDLCQLIDREYQHLEDIFALNSYQRVSKKLYQLSQEKNTDILDIDQHKMSNLLAMSRETTNRSLSKLKEKGAISVERSRIKIVDGMLLQEQFMRRLA